MGPPPDVSRRPGKGVSLTLLTIGMLIVVIGLFLYTDRENLREDLRTMLGNDDNIRIPSRTEINRLKVARMDKLRELLFRCRHQQYFESMIAAGVDRISLIAEGRDSDRVEAHIKPVHWIRIVKQARALLLRNNDITTRPPSTRIPVQLAEESTNIVIPATSRPVKATRAPTPPPPPKTAPPAEEEPQPTQQQTPHEDYLLLSSLTAGFASGVRTQLIPFLGLAAHLNRTAVLPAASFGIPAFRSTSKDEAQGFVPLSTFIDVEQLKKDLPCVRMISYEEWKLRTDAKVDVVFLGSESESGNKSSPGITSKIATKPLGAKVGFQSCYPQLMHTLQSSSAYREKSYWGGPWDFIGETQHVLKTEKTIVNDVKCAPLWQLKATTKELFSTGSQSVMIANFPGLIRNAYFWHSQHAKGEMYVFSDVSKEVCKTWTSDFSRWPELSPEWKAVAKKVVDQRFGETPFACVHIRGEKLVLGAVKDEKVTIKELNGNAYMKNCIESLTIIIKDAMAKSGNQLFLISDLDPVTGSPSAQRDRSFKQWITWAGKLISNSTSDTANGFCNSAEQEELLKSGPKTLQTALSIFPGNCAAGEAAVCQLAKTVTRFGKGSMGSFVAGGKPATKFETCPEIIAAAEKLRSTT
eukprot:TRINITY_DN4639_c0_g1_i1.p1 TRINITY_DN4639_c0_g1~~TRINITY_DN4639_c0_g1_i1.p1  ORF type:complete len:638 (+),score=94.20 TRINITY_DN4639_c0_g1_i1:99-2012(+)